MASTNKIYHFLKVEIPLSECEEFLEVERTENGPRYLWLLTRLALRFANNSGVLSKQIGERVLPVTLDDIAADMRGGFSKTQIKEGFFLLEQNHLIYINSNGFYAITGLTMDGDPAEPTLHLQNSNGAEIRPYSVGRDTSSARYYREYRELKKTEEKKLIDNPNMLKKVSYTEMAKRAGCTKQTIINQIKKYHLEDKVISNGQVKYLPERWAMFIISIKNGKKISDEISSLIREKDGVSVEDLLESKPSNLNNKPSKELSNIRQLPSSSPSNLDCVPSNIRQQPSNRGMKNTDEIKEFDGFANANHSANLGANFPLIESIRDKEIDDDIQKTVKSENELKEIYSIGFDDVTPTNSDMTMLVQLLKQYGRDHLLNALKRARKTQAQSMAYVKRILENDANAMKEFPDSEYFKITSIDPNRDVSKIVNRYLSIASHYDVYPSMDEIKQFENKKVYWTDLEMSYAARNMSMCGDFSSKGIEAAFKQLDYWDGTGI